MAPRRRPQKVGLKRLDAAIDALRPLGFSRELVSKTVKALLKVYDGDEGWVFIEEASYKLLIETILEEQEKCLVNVQKDDSSEDGAPSGVGTSSEVVGIEPICTNIETTSQIIEMITESNCLHPAGVSWKDISLDHSSPQKQIDVALPAICGNKNSKSCCIVQSVKIEPVHFPPTLGSLQSQRRRKPCNGWISSEDEVDNVFLMTDALPRQPTCRGGRMDCGRKRKMRWDVKPEDM